VEALVRKHGGLSQAKTDAWFKKHKSGSGADGDDGGQSAGGMEGGDLSGLPLIVRRRILKDILTPLPGRYKE